MNKKRDRLEIIHDILHAIQQKDGKIRPTHILYKSNLSHQMMDEYLNELISKGFVQEQEDRKGKVYALTEKGFEYINKYRLITEFIDSFGLSD